MGGETAADIERETAWLVGIVERELALHPEAPLPVAAGADRATIAAVESGLGRPAAVFDPHPLAASFAASEAGRAFMAGGPLIPDQIVYTGSWPLALDLGDADPGRVAAVTRAAAAAFEAEHGVPPIVTVVPGFGLVATGESERQADTARLVCLDMLAVGATALRLGGVRHMARAERTFIEQWEAEAYRKQVAANG